MNNYENIIENISKKTIIQRKSLLKSFEKFDDLQHYEIINNKNLLFHKLKSKNKEIEKNSILELAALYIAIDEFMEQLNEIDKKLIKFKNKNKSNLKKEKLRQYWSIVKELKELKKMSFRDIALYLKKYHKFNISFSTIFQEWNKIEILKEELDEKIN